MGARQVWAIIAGQYTQSWGLYGLSNWLPTYLGANSRKIKSVETTKDPRAPDHMYNK